MRRLISYMLHECALWVIYFGLWLADTARRVEIRKLP